MRVFHSCERQLLAESVLTLGAFDGMHLGHQALCQQVLQIAKAKQLPAALVTFEPLPKAYFAKSYDKQPLSRILQLRDKAMVACNWGFGALLCLRFDEKLAVLTAEMFVKQCLVESLGVKHIVVGDDFVFGYRREGNLALLEQLGLRYGFSVSSIPTLLQEGQRVSSSRVRAALLAGDFALAKMLLGRDYCLSGRVQHGAKLGRELGFPTINLRIDHEMVVFGIYVVSVHCGRLDKTWQGVASVGTRPTIREGLRRLLEVHLLTPINESLYGEQVTVTFYQKLREELKFTSLSALVMQMRNDCEQARAYFGSV